VLSSFGSSIPASTIASAPPCPSTASKAVTITATCVTVHANFTVSAVSAFRENVSAETEFVPLHHGRSRNQAETVW